MTRRLAAVLVLLCPLASAAEDDGRIAAQENHFARFGRQFAGLAKIDPVKGEIELVTERGGRMLRLPIRSDAEFFRHWAPAAPEDFAVGLRLWIWTTTDEKGQALDVRMVADEITAQAMHRQRYEFAGDAPDGKVRFRGKVKDSPESLTLVPPEGFRPPAPGTKLLVQTAFDAGRKLVEVLTDAELETARLAQHKKHDARFAKTGVPAVVNLSEDVSAEVMLSVWRPGDRWVRGLDYGDTLEILPAAGGPVPARVTDITVRGNRTRLTVVAEGKFHHRLPPGAAVSLKFPRPKLPADFDEPPDTDRHRTRDERVVWLQSNIHCICGSGGDVCAGDFLTLYLCNGHLCGHPRQVARRIDAWIGAGKTDREILKLLREEEGTVCLRPHLRP
jgi:hypothetical protein